MVGSWNLQVITIGFQIFTRGGHIATVPAAWVHEAYKCPAPTPLSCSITGGEEGRHSSYPLFFEKQHVRAGRYREAEVGCEEGVGQATA